MLIMESKYRLDEFIIIEHGEVLLTWVMHIALGDQRSGNGYIIGNIFVLEHWNHEEAGFLKLEFHEQLMKLPAWNKTRYYCFASSLRKVGIGRSLTGDMLKQLAIKKNDRIADSIEKTGKFRLGRYKITVDEERLISWKTIREADRILYGKCFAESGILFLGPKEGELDEGQSKKSFFADLKLLPQWDKTFAWGHSGSLMNCKALDTRKTNTATWKPEHEKSFLSNAVSFSRGQKFREERISEFKLSGFKWLKTAWHRIVEWKVWDRIMPLVIGGIFFGFRIVIFVAEKVIYISNRIIQRFHKYRNNMK